MFSVHGSSGSNWIVLRALALERQDAVVLVARSIHHSVINALKAYGLDFRFLPTPYEPRYEALLPPSVEQVVEGLRRAPEAVAVFYTSPTYEGLTRGHARDRRGRPRARRPHAMVVVDEAWGGHLHFHPALPRVGDGGGRRRLRAVDAQARRRAAADRADPLARGPRRLGADGGGLPRVRHDLALATTCWRRPTRRCGRWRRTARRRSGARSSAPSALKAGLRVALPRPRLPRRRALAARGARPRRAACDLVKTTIGLSRYRLSGYEVAEALVERGIVIEKAGVQTITLITTFQLGPTRPCRTRWRALADDAGRAGAARRRARAGCRATRSRPSTTGP